VYAPPQGSAVHIARVFGDDGGIPVRLEAGAAGTGERQAYMPPGVRFPVKRALW
jgi:hypothetical protein